ncbi:hypothetical protein [Marisediminicola sp. LYQ134]|uniref:hypothetical protein n=1 Tax=unclassified Marisediminicola TaxID=2618316 RepID=UPI00398330E7
MATDYIPNPEDEREVDLVDETEPPTAAPTIDPDERVELADAVAPLDDDRVDGD